jgi:D-psicose/D-tagatose/L-ribulose 3-epimerase
MVAMAHSTNRDIYFSFFMFTADLRPDDRVYTKQLVRHIQALQKLGYTGFDLPIAPTDTRDHQKEIESYAGLKQAFNDAGLKDVRFTTNVGATRTFDPSSMYAEQRAIALAYLKSRVDITKALGGDIMAGPIILPYGVFPTTDGNQAIWSDTLQDWLKSRYQHAAPVLEKLAEYAANQGVKVAIEPVDHWETPSPNMVGDVMRFLGDVASPQLGVCIDSAHVVLGSDGPAAFIKDVRGAAKANRLHYVHISAPDRGAVQGSWIPWKPFLEPILEGYDGPLLVEVFNAIPVFLNSLRLTRRRFLIPDEETLDPGRPDAYTVAREAIAAVRRELNQIDGLATTDVAAGRLDEVAKR